MHIGAYELESPLINGGGVVKSVEDVRLMAQTAVGAVLFGSATLEPRLGNSAHGEQVYYHDAESGITYNALGLPNKGMQYVVQNIREMVDIAHDHGKPFILNFAPVTSMPISEVRQMAMMLSRARISGLDGFEFNASCPNVVLKRGQRHELLSHHPKRLGKVLLELQDISANMLPLGTIMARIAPFEHDSDAIKLAKVVHDTGIDVVTAFNTFPYRKPKNPDKDKLPAAPAGVGGRSGPGMQHKAEKQTHWLVEARSEVGADFDIIGSTGIASGEAIKRRLDLGCAAVSATTVFYEGRSLGEAADTLLREYAEQAE